jgi:hypothetical protein
MDLNYLFLRQQIERTLAAAAKSSAAREAHEEMARQYELEIERMSGGRIIFPWSRDSGAIDPGSDQLISERPTPSASS